MQIQMLLDCFDIFSKYHLKCERDSLRRRWGEFRQGRQPAGFECIA